MRYRFVPYVVVLALWTALNLAAAQEAASERGLQRLPIKDANGREVGLYTGSFALVIGVSDYDEWTDLPGVRDDVPQVRAALEKHGFHVTVFENPTGAELREKLRAFVYKHGQEAGRRILIYFAGHGHSMEPSFGGPNMGYIVPRDAPDPHHDAVGFRATAINMDRIESYAVEIQAKHALFLFDSCFSGSIFTLTRARPEGIQAKTARPVRQFITAGTEDEKVPDESIFRAQFVLALEGEADKDGDGYVTGSELGHFLQKRVQNYSEQAQNPQYGTLRNPNLSQGDFVFPLPRDEEKEGWEAIRDSTDPSDFRTFIEGFPEGRFAAEAQGRLDELEQARWETIRDTGDPAVLRAFVKAFPDGRFAVEAQRRLARLEEARWAAVKGSTDPSDFRAFLRDFPDGHHTGEARRLLDQLQQVAVCSGYVQADQFIRATYCYRRILSADADHELAQRGLYEIAEHYFARAAEVMEEARGHARSYDDAMLQVAEAVRQLEGVDAKHSGIGELRSRLKGLRRGDEAQLTALRGEVEQLQGENERLREGSVKQSQALLQAQEQATRLEREVQQRDQALQQVREQAAELERLVEVEKEARAWDELKQSKCASDFEAFRGAYPNGRFANEALQKWRKFQPEARKWEAIKNSTQVSDFRTFLATYPVGCFAEDARHKLRQMQNVWRDPVTGMNFVHIPLGCFAMGSPLDEAGRYGDEGPRHEVCVDSFWMGETEVTNAQYRRFKSDHDGGSTKKGHSLNDDAQPVTNVSWRQAQAYAEWLSGRNTYTFSLPTEAEWEYACRAGTQTARHWGESPDAACPHANVADMTAQRHLEGLRGLHNCDDERGAPAPVGRYASNGFGLHDTLGNVSEWVRDTYGRDAYARRARKNPIHEDSRDSHRVIRGGNAWSVPGHVRCAMRNHDVPEDVMDSVGFRLRMTKKAQPLQGEQQRRAEQARQQEEPRKRKAQKSRLKNLLPMVHVQGGAFTMGCTPEQDGYDGDCYGDEKPAHRVRVRSFEIGKYEVTQGLWEAVMGDNPSGNTCYRCPVEQVSWDDVQAFLEKLNTLTGERYRLPTEAEWEYAARGGQRSDGYQYAGSNNPGSVAWYEANDGGKIHPVGQKQSNELGLHDMSGNVWEWVQDCWHDNYGRVAPGDGRAWESGGDCSRRVLRGGSWNYGPRLLRTANRSGSSTGFRGSNVGFRIARTLTP